MSRSASRSVGHFEQHAVNRIGWLRAAVLGANDGIVSTASLIIGIAAAGTARSDMILAGVAGLVAGAMSMAAGEYVSVSSQSDTEKADLARERAELVDDPEHELEELTGIYQARGLDRATAQEVARQLTAHDSLAAHARDELGLTDTGAARPLQAAFASAATFTAGAALPLLSVMLAPVAAIIPVVAVSALAFLILLGWLGARAGNAPPVRAIVRVTFWGAAAMLATALIGRAVGVAV